MNKGVLYEINTILMTQFIVIKKVYSVIAVSPHKKLKKNKKNADKDTEKETQPLVKSSNLTLALFLVIVPSF